ncbi:DUF4232 domain-containing protein [Streptomyces sp. BBFR102]|uniref:DUF4232 domain-containing protein n=1 Tax=Streptomyces sp. BBFR102 TaxID=3448171 RepID=UPI003F52AA14
MRSRLAARSTRLVLAAAAVTAIAATSTACDPEDRAAADSASSAPAGSGSNADGGSDSGSGGSSKPADGGDKGVQQTCGTNDLDLTVTAETQAGGYYLLTAKAQPGITCLLEPHTLYVNFGTHASGVAEGIGQGGLPAIKLSGSAKAYAGINPKTTNSDSGLEIDNVTIAVMKESDMVTLKLPDTATVQKPVVTNWTSDPAGAVPELV